MEGRDVCQLGKQNKLEQLATNIPLRKYENSFLKPFDSIERNDRFKMNIYWFREI